MGGAAPAVAFHDLEPAISDFETDVLAGLSRPRKELAPKYFYDERGSELFHEICGLEEYYPTRAEMEILETAGGEIGAHVGPNATLVEFGSGNNLKIRALLEGLETPAAYVAIDISRDYLIKAAQDLLSHHPSLEVVAVCADYTEPFELPALGGGATGDRLGLFFGSTIGNLNPVQAHRFLALAAGSLGPGAAMLVGVDLKKDPAVLDAAYNDAKGVTAAFNLNLLARINRELGGDFDLAGFAHAAHYDIEQGRIEMHLRSLGDQTVEVAGQRFAFHAGETIHTENSYKYAVSEFQTLAQAAGFAAEALWTDAAGRFSLHLLRVR